MTLKEIKNAIATKLESAFPGKVEQDIQKFFTSPQKHLTVIFQEENAAKEATIPMLSSAGTVGYGVMFDFRDLKGNADAMDVIDSVIETLSGYLIDPSAGDEARLQYTGTKLAELQEGSGTWLYTISFSLRRELHIKTENL